MRPWVLHVDLDQFVAAVEVLRHPELAGRPVVVGGRGEPAARAVVATASYEARAFGVRSGMPLRTAARRCPEAVFLPSDPPAYDAMSQRVMAALRGLDGVVDGEVVVEVLGWDEAFLGVTTDDPEQVARAAQAAVRAATDLSCAVGIGDNTLRAKLATQYGKPGGVFRLTAENWFDVLGAQPTETLWGIGRRTARKLAELGLHTVADLAAADPAVLAARLGPSMGPWYVQLGRGIGRAEVSGAPWVPRSRGHETTFAVDLTEPARVREEAAALARQVAADVLAAGRPAVRVGLKVRYAPFFTITRSATLPAPTSDADTLVAAVLDVLDRVELDRPVRLLGVRAEFT
ncbi:MAG: DNA polymerase IV [Pseudonocardia sp.]